VVKLLLVEDDQTLGLSLRLALTAQGHEVEVAPSLARARASLELARSDVVVLDLGLPDGDGLELIADLRERGDITPILVLTARITLTDRCEGLRLGADDYLTKPFDLPELVARIDALMRRHGWAHPSVARTQGTVSVGRLAVDFATRNATCDGAAVTLSDLELRFLNHLVDNTGIVVSREELLTAVWDLPATSKTRSIDTFVYRLRRLIETDPSRPTILLSVRGAGWRLSQAQPSAADRA
jgi:DNA-binding response OmpR family regulator